MKSLPHIFRALFSDKDFREIKTNQERLGTEVVQTFLREFSLIGTFDLETSWTLIQQLRNLHKCSKNEKDEVNSTSYSTCVCLACRTARAERSSSFSSRSLCFGLCWTLKNKDSKTCNWYWDEKQLHVTDNTQQKQQQKQKPKHTVRSHLEGYHLVKEQGLMNSWRFRLLLENKMDDPSLILLRYGLLLHLLKRNVIFKVETFALIEFSKLPSSSLQPSAVIDKVIGEVAVFMYAVHVGLVKVDDLTLIQFLDLIKSRIANTDRKRKTKTKTQTQQESTLGKSQEIISLWHDFVSCLDFTPWLSLLNLSHKSDLTSLDVDTFLNDIVRKKPLIKQKQKERENKERSSDIKIIESLQQERSKLAEDLRICQEDYRRLKRKCESDHHEKQKVDQCLGAHGLKLFLDPLVKLGNFMETLKLESWSCSAGSSSSSSLSPLFELAAERYADVWQSHFSFSCGGGGDQKEMNFRRILSNFAISVRVEESSSSSGKQLREICLLPAILLYYTRPTELMGKLKSLQDSITTTGTGLLFSYVIGSRPKLENKKSSTAAAAVVDDDLKIWLSKFGKKEDIKEDMTTTDFEKCLTNLATVWNHFNLIFTLLQIEHSNVQLLKYFLLYGEQTLAKKTQTELFEHSRTLETTSLQHFNKIFYAVALMENRRLSILQEEEQKFWEQITSKLQTFLKK